MTRWWQCELHGDSTNEVPAWPGRLQQPEAQTWFKRVHWEQRDKGYCPNQERCFLLSGRASFLNLRTIMTEIVLEEEFKQNKMGTMAGNHSEILSNEPQCWLEAAEPGRSHDPSDLPGLAAHSCPLPTPETSAALLTRCHLHRSFLGKAAPGAAASRALPRGSLHCLPASPPSSEGREWSSAQPSLCALRLGQSPAPH